ncbi:MAG: DUF4034 domain-containing protein [bacterium]|nr:DUF4034 domain-containing protein [bacterium]
MHHRGLTKAAGVVPQLPEPQLPLLTEADAPTEPPFVGASGVDEHGYPRALPDRVALMNLLRLRRFDELERFMVFYQEAFEKEFRKELWPDRAVRAFFVADGSLEPLFDEWIEAKPDSFGALAARANYRYSRALHFRGGKATGKTEAERFDAMRAELRPAVPDLRRALELRPKFQAAYRRLISMHAWTGDLEARKTLLRDSLKECPNCLLARRTYLLHAGPRWGGEAWDMSKFVEEQAPAVAKNSRLAVLAGYPHWERCHMLQMKKDYEGAARACDEALKSGPELLFLGDKGGILRRQKKYEEARAVADQILKIDAQDTEGLRLRGAARLQLRDFRGAVDDLALARRLAPGGSAWDVDYAKRRLSYEGSELNKAGKHDAAAEMFALGLKLDPADHEFMERQGWNQKQAGLSEAQIQQKLAAAPDDFELHLRMDHGWAAGREFDKVVKMWDHFIARHPDDPRAYRERGGAKWQLGRREDGLADMKKACELGFAAACKDEKGMGGSTR